MPTLAILIACPVLIIGTLVIAWGGRNARQDVADDLSYDARLASPLNGDVWTGMVVRGLHEAPSTAKGDHDHG